MKSRLLLALSTITLFGPLTVNAQQSIARQWNERLLGAIRKDFARPTVHARNLFHVSAAMYDAWAAYDDVARPWLLGDTVGGFVVPFIGVPTPSNIDSARNEAISFAAYRMIIYRFKNSPGKTTTYAKIDSVMLALGYDKNYTSTNYWNGNPAALGNYIADRYIAFGQQDGANEGATMNYANQYYAPINPTIMPIVPGNPDIDDPNRWQPLTLNVFIDQSGNVIPVSTPPFLSPEWGNVTPFSLTEADKTVYTRDGHNWNVYHDPGPFPTLDTLNQGGLSDEYKWNFALNAVWSGHHDPSDSVMWDISPASVGNNTPLPAPTDWAAYHNFYDLINGGDQSQGHALNPKTGLPYTPQIVPRGDATRVLTRYWSDGPGSETPPGHWFTILNYVMDHPLFEKRWEGQGPIMNDLEWDIKAYFTLGGTVHDVAVAVWGAKGWYDGVRPLSALRYMCDQGQSSDSTLPSYSPNGIPLIPGHIELVDSLDPLAIDSVENIGKIKLYAWKAFDSIPDPDTTYAGAGWILAERWWPYFPSTFVTPPFAGYPSGHSAFSRGAAEVMTMLTGDPFFPGGMAEFHAEQNEYFEDEDGPSVDINLQWATYRDASDQCSLSRIWGGIHPPMDDIPSRYMGIVIGPQAFNHAETYFDARPPQVAALVQSLGCIYDDNVGTATFEIAITFDEEMDTTVIPVCTFPVEDVSNSLTTNIVSCQWETLQRFLAVFDVSDANERIADVDVRISGAVDAVGNVMETLDAPDGFTIDTRNPEVVSIVPSLSSITDDQIGTGSFSLGVVFDEAMNTANPLTISFPNEDPTANTLSVGSGSWVNDQLFVRTYDVLNSHETLLNIDVEVTDGNDECGNDLATTSRADVFSIALTPSGIAELGDLTLLVYPNPVSAAGQVTVELETFVPGTTVTVIDAHGRFVATKEMTSRFEAIDLAHVGSGLYMVRVSNTSGVAGVMIEVIR